MTTKFIPLVSLLLLPAQLLAQAPQLGSCPDYPVVQNFNLTEYMGIWYEIEKSAAAFNAGTKCVTSIYTEQPRETFEVVNTQRSTTGYETKITGFAEQITFDESAKFMLTIPALPFEIEKPYWILKTDYVNYAIVWTCSDMYFLNCQTVRVLARVREPTKEIRAEVHRKLKSLGITPEHLRETIQDDCYG